MTTSPDRARSPLPVERFESTPLNDGTDHVALVIHFRDPNTGAEWREHHPRMRKEDHGTDENGNHHYTFSPATDPDALHPYFSDETQEPQG